MKWFVIVNPVSGKKYAIKYKEKLIHALDQLELPYELAYTKYSEHEVELVAQAVENDFYKFISVGGDGTLHHVVNGVMLQKKIPISKIEIGVIPLGTGNDWVKQYDIPQNTTKAIKIINANKTIKQDIGKINVHDKTVYFNNVAGIGFDGFVVKNIDKRYGALSYLIASLKSIVNYKPIKIEVTINNKEIIDSSFMLTLGICKFSGGGMQLTDNPDPTDGLLDITLIKNTGLGSLLWNMPKLFNGKIMTYKNAQVFKSDKVILKTFEQEKAFIQADGELIGKGDFQVEILSKSICFIVK